MNNTIKDIIDNFYLFEGKAGYEPQEGDSFSDHKSDIVSKILQLLIDEISVDIKNNDPDNCYTSIGLIQFFVSRLTNCFYGDYTYYKKLVELKKLYNKGIKLCKDPEWFKHWKNPNNIKYELEKNEGEFDRILNNIVIKI